ncbi:MAG: hypothetical protein QOE41_76, partial [Mycobacterium sp.]|nr:hypothetical protein [Mycobacterium sp.]MDT5130765.1 hypothetical protein [Mycobacterium sp.]
MYQTEPADAPVRLRPTLLGIASAFPPFEVSRKQSWEYFFQYSSVPFAKRIVE